MENSATIPLPPQDHAILSRLLDDQDQSLQSQTKPDEIEELEECPSRTQDDWVTSMKDELEQLHRLENEATWNKLCIYRIPKHLHEMHDKSYSPQTISIGPYHNGEKHLQSMESHKGRAVIKVLVRSNQRLEVYIDAMRELEEKARACYEGVISMSSNEFTKMLVFDGCFVLETLMGSVGGFNNLGYTPTDPVFGIRESMHLIQRDMLMLENQLPLFVLNRLYEAQLESVTHNIFVEGLAIRCFTPLITNSKILSYSDHLDNMGKEMMVHFLDVLPNLNRQRRWNLGFREGNKRVVDKRQQHIIHCMMKLRDVGINFREGETDQFWDIRFVNGYLEIPKLFIHEGTKSLFLNLIAFEQCHIASSNAITSYITFMGNLIYSAEDVSYLRECGIIEHWLESDSKVIDLFNQIGHQDIHFNSEDCYLYHLSVEVERYYYDQCHKKALKIYEHRNKYFRQWNGWMKTLKEKYLDSPWAYISLFAAIILLVLTSFQCYYAAYEHYKTY